MGRGIDFNIGIIVFSSDCCGNGNGAVSIDRSIHIALRAARPVCVVVTELRAVQARFCENAPPTIACVATSVRWATRGGGRGVCVAPRPVGGVPVPVGPVLGLVFVVVAGAFPTPGDCACAKCAAARCVGVV